MECKNYQKNNSFCTCTYPGCSRKGICCECIRYHLPLNQLPGCFFPSREEKTYDRSREFFLQCQK